MSNFIETNKFPMQIEEADGIRLPFINSRKVDYYIKNGAHHITCDTVYRPTSWFSYSMGMITGVILASGFIFICKK